MTDESMKKTSMRAVGQRAEGAAADYLEEQGGYRIIARNYHGRGGEIDLIGWDGEILCFVEVRARAHHSWVDPLETVDALKMRRIIGAAQSFLDSQWQGPLPLMRFDVVGVCLDPLSFQLVKNAFDTSGAIHG